MKQTILLLNQNNKQIIENLIKNQNVEYITLTIDNMEQICDCITNIIYHSFNQMQNLDNTENQQYFEKYNGKVSQIVYSLIDKYIDNGNQIEMVCELLVRLIQAHTFSNGNKRTSLITISNVLNFFGLNLDIKENQIEDYVNFMLNVSAYKEKDVRDSLYSKLDEKQFILEIYNFLTKDLTTLKTKKIKNYQIR